jgi:N4-gp56 family major capsid protein
VITKLNEEALTLYNDSVILNQLRHATRSQGKMSEQRVPWSVRQENKDSLADWWKERMETSIFNQLAGNSDQSDTRYTGNNTAVAPTAAKLIVGGEETAEASLSATTTHAIDLADIDKCVAIAKVQSPRLRPIRVGGKNRFVAFLHPYQIRQMRGQTAAGGWYDLHDSMLQGGKYNDNPILSGAEFIYNNTIVYESSYLPNVAAAVTSNTSYRRGVFLGAQAGVIAYGQGGKKNKMDWQEELFDYGNQLGCSAGMIYGMTKTIPAP